MKLIYLAIGLLLLSLVAAAPPELENHQFYGKVYWDKTATVPKEVVAKLGSTTWKSKVDVVQCTTNPCNGKYGYGKDNFIFIQGKKGDSIDFYVDAKKVKSATYVEWGTTELDLSVATVPVKCDAKWKCAGWSTCSNKKQNRTCTDENSCDKDKLKKTEEQSCGTQSNTGGGTGGTKSGKKSTTTSASPKVCVYRWDCSDWSGCFNGDQTRSCVRGDDCDAQEKAKKVTSVIKYPKPAVSKFCVTKSQVKDYTKVEDKKFFPPETQKPAVTESCSDGKKNQNEEGVDCGGVCKECEKGFLTGISPMYYYIGGGVLLLVLIVVVLLLRGGLSSDVKSELKSVFAKGRSRGMSDSQIRAGLIKKGWDEKTVSKVK